MLIALIHVYLFRRKHADSKILQWNPQLTTTIQHDGLRDAVVSILEKSNQLSTFAPQNLEPYSLDPGGDVHLTRKSHLRRQTYRRSIEEHESFEAPKSVTYHARDRWRATHARSNVVECVNLIINWPSKIGTTTDLAGILKDWPEIGGFIGIFEKPLLSDILGLQIASEWGSLVKLCYASSAKDAYQLMFLFSTISFRQDIDMRIVRTVIAFAILEELKGIPTPAWPVYKGFKEKEIPQAEYLQQLMQLSLTSYEGDKLSKLDLNFPAKQRKKFDALQRAFEQQQEKDSKMLADFLLHQWPCPEPTIEGFTKSVLLDIQQAMEDIRPEWLRLFQNLGLSRYVSQVQDVLDKHHRWQTIETLLKMVESHLWNLQKGFPQSIEVIRREQGRFPVVFFLSKDAEDELISRLIDEIYRGRTSLFPEDIKKVDRLAIKRYISEPKVSSDVVQQINNLIPKSQL